MLVRLSIRDIVLIERLDIDFSAGLSVLTGETGAGKSILLDAFALALGARGDATLVRQGADQGQVTAVFELPDRHPARALMKEQGIDVDDAMILRRVQLSDGKTRAFVNDQPVSVQALKALGSALVEIHGQHDERHLRRGLADLERSIVQGGNVEREVSPAGELRRDGSAGGDVRVHPSCASATRWRRSWYEPMNVRSVLRVGPHASNSSAARPSGS